MDEALYQSCDWCGDYINDVPSRAGNLNFCDILCAKLYNDNVNKIDFEFDSINTQTKRLRKIYDLCKNMMFEELPIYTTNLTDRKEIKHNYEELFMK